MIILGIVLLIAAFIFKMASLVVDLAVFLIIVGVLVEIFGGGTGLSLRGRFGRRP